MPLALEPGSDREVVNLGGMREIFPKNSLNYEIEEIKGKFFMIFEMQSLIYEKLELSIS
jgi:hypothetical protein